MHLHTVLTSIALLSTTGLAQYVLEDDYLGDGNFFDMFSFFTASDPTHGSVNYVDQSTANSEGMIHFTNGQAYMGVDHTNVAPNGRASVRVTSNKSYNSGLVILDLAHMPGGICGTWPAFWMVGSNWPANGEIDIIEGVHDQTTNDMTLHTSDGCSISKTNSMTGYTSTTNCFVNAAGQYDNQGCGIGTGNTQTYGTGFNSIGGGVYATQWSSDAIKIYFFPRSSIPSDISSGNPNPAGWGSPIASFSGSCSIPDHFKGMQLVFDTTFCGDWAGATWSSSSCASKASTCQAFVANNPSAFQDAYWLVNSLKVYQPVSGGSQSTKVAQTTQAPQTTQATQAQQTTAQTTQAQTTLATEAQTTHTTEAAQTTHTTQAAQTTAAAAQPPPPPPAAPVPQAVATHHIVSANVTTQESSKQEAAPQDDAPVSAEVLPGSNIVTWGRAARHLARHLKGGFLEARV